MLEAFVGVQEWYDVNRFNDSTQKATLREKITGILLHLKGENANRLKEHLEQISVGYNIFLKEYVPKITTTKPVPIETFYEAFWGRYHDTSELQEFIEFFEFIQIKSYSEAICESVGSIMNMATGNISCCNSPCSLCDHLTKEVFLAILAFCFLLL